MTRMFPWKISRKNGAIDFNRTTEFYDKTARIAHSSEKQSKRAKRQAIRQATEWSKGGTVLTSTTNSGKRISISKKDAQAASEAWYHLAN